MLAEAVFSRRELFLASAFTLLPTVAVAAGGDIFVSAATENDRRHLVRGFYADAKSVSTLFSHELPGRAHHVAVHSALGLYVVVARRPGTWLALGRLDGSPPLLVSVPEDRRTCGHGFFSAAGDEFYSVETDSRDVGDDGLLVQWQVTSNGGLVRGREFSTAGVGPHEAVLMADDRTVVVANGGYRTGWDEERVILDRDSMSPSLVYLDRDSGELLQKITLDPALHQDSIRHLDVNALGQVVFAMQYEGEPFADVPLVAMHRLGDENIHLPAVPLAEQQQLQQYCGSVRFDNSGRFAAVSAPRGNRITLWDVAEGSFHMSLRSRDGCGVCAWKDGFLFTAGTGKVSYVEPVAGYVTSLATDDAVRLYWDNHLSRV